MGAFRDDRSLAVCYPGLGKVDFPEVVDVSHPPQLLFEREERYPTSASECCSNAPLIWFAITTPRLISAIRSERLPLSEALREELGDISSGGNTVSPRNALREKAR